MLIRDAKFVQRFSENSAARDSQMQRLAAIEPAAASAASTGRSTISVCDPPAPMAVTAPTTFPASTSNPSRPRCDRARSRVTMKVHYPLGYSTCWALDRLHRRALVVPGPGRRRPGWRSGHRCGARQKGPAHLRPASRLSMKSGRCPCRYTLPLRARPGSMSARCSARPGASRSTQASRTPQRAPRRSPTSTGTPGFCATAATR